MSQSKILTVFGATGIQGGSVVRAVLAHPTLSKKYKIRAVTRDPSKPDAQALVSQDVEVVKADMDDAESLARAVAGSFAVFAVTNYWEKLSKESEVKQGKAMADASRAAGVKHLVWSAVPNATRLTNGALTGLKHFDSKAEVAEYIETMKGDMVATYFMPGVYMQNFKTMIRHGQDGIPTLSVPWNAETQVALIDAATDSGIYVAGILSQDPKSVNGVWVQAVSEWLTPNEIVRSMTKITGIEVKFQSVPEDIFKGFLPQNIATELTENMVLIRDFSYYGKGQEREQANIDKKVLGGAKKMTWEKFVKMNGPWKWEDS